MSTKGKVKNKIWLGQGQTTIYEMDVCYTDNEVYTCYIVFDCIITDRLLDHYILVDGIINNDFVYAFNYEIIN